MARFANEFQLSDKWFIKSHIVIHFGALPSSEKSRRCSDGRLRSKACSRIAEIKAGRRNFGLPNRKLLCGKIAELPATDPKRFSTLRPISPLAQGSLSQCEAIRFHRNTRLENDQHQTIRATLRFDRGFCRGPCGWHQRRP